MAAPMTTKDMHEFVDSGTKTAKFAWVGSDGRPHVAPIWFVRDGDDFVFNTATASAKGRALLRDPRVCLLIDDEAPPFAFVKINGVATLSDDLAEMLPWATKIGGRYMGADRAEEFGRRNTSGDELLVRVTPTKIISATDVAGY